MNILLAIDDSRFAEEILQFVQKQSWFDKAEFTLLHVVEPMLVGSYLSVLPSPVLDELKEKARVGATELLNNIAAKLRQSHPDVQVKTELIEGFAREEIIGYARKWPADLIVVGSHGRTAVMSLLLGSVSQAVITTAPCSVLVVRCKSEELPTWPRSH